MASASENRNQRFADISGEKQKEILENIDSKNTKRSTNTAVKVFREYLQQRGKSADFESFSEVELDAALAKFYLEARSEKGEHYKKVTLTSYRHGIQRHLEKTRKGIDIIRGADFKESTTAFKAMGKELKRMGCGEIKHYPPVAEADLAKLYDYVCSSDSPFLLQYKVFVDIMLHFGRRGRENLSSLRFSDLAVTTDAEGDMYVYMTRDEQTKNHQEDGDRAQGRMYEKKDNPRCPVRTFIKYIRRLNQDCPKLFQQPNSQIENGDYFHAVPLGHNRLGSMMATLSTKAGLSQKYTNHSLRATTVHVLDAAQVPSRHIMTVTGHKAETSLKTYTGFTDDKTKKRMSATISDMTCAPPTGEKKNTMPILNDSDLTDFLTDCDFDEILQTMPVPQSSVSVPDNNSMHVLNRNMTNRSLFQMPAPVLNNCNVTINYNFKS